ncbi:hypothetical protein D3C72_1185830 [compost metagenome]
MMPPPLLAMMPEPLFEIRPAELLESKFAGTMALPSIAKAPRLEAATVLNTASPFERAAQPAPKTRASVGNSKR